MESQSYSITQLTQTPDDSTQITIPLGTYLHVAPNSYSPRGFELAGLYCIYAFEMPMKNWQQTMMDKARTVTDTKTL